MKRRRGLTEEDRDLWSRYSRTADPLHPIKRSKAPDTPKPKPDAAPLADPIPEFSVGQRVNHRASTFTPTPTISEDIARAPLRMDAKTHRRMRSGKLRPEGKLDLHGMTLDTAHPALTRFILSSQAQGRRLVIVVTGKGKARDGGGPIPTRIGVLKHQVPQWLRMAPLSGVVQQVTEAHRTHGGSGAYYVYLRR
ncbi:Smr/MutS family protein [Jannaschia pohangensis]|uniref:DNA-nicking endonuclease, Smr domain n=1 Tax=Jannaschia pohangensis TaxID=390807 RepID=A0A1I3TJ95_9RHOB|nr:Smr/MutS family protein [Jannaschia pohangensis]SFJ69577.1 DNA-nicking endonuclease, Smr domain [Jannaschia pohangensis]